MTEKTEEIEVIAKSMDYTSLMYAATHLSAGDVSKAGEQDLKDLIRKARKYLNLVFDAAIEGGK